MAVHRGPVSLRPRCIRGVSSLAAMPIYQSTAVRKLVWAIILCRPDRSPSATQPLVQWVQVSFLGVKWSVLTSYQRTCLGITATYTAAYSQCLLGVLLW
jgi:hypothetical protein